MAARIASISSPAESHKIQSSQEPLEPYRAKEPIAKRVLPWTSDAETKYNMIEECPVFTPTLNEFLTKTFSEILIECESQCGTSGIFKVSLCQLLS